MSRAISLFLLLMFTWVLWSGHTFVVDDAGSGLHVESLMLFFGVASCGLAVWLTMRMRALDDEGLPTHLVTGLVTFVPWVFWQIIKSNIDVAKIVLASKPNIRPHLIHLEVGQDTELGKVIHANTITITPGTVTLDIEGGYLLVHALTDEAAEEDASGVVDERVTLLERGGKL